MRLPNNTTRSVTPYAVQVLANSGIMMAIVYVPLLARQMHASGSQIGLLVAVYQAAMFLSNTLFGRWADFGDRKRFVVFGLAASALALAGHVFARNLAGLFLARAVAGICVGMFPSALVAYFYEGSPRLGRFSGFGSLGWSFGAVAAGLAGLGWFFPLAGALIAAAMVLAAAGLRRQHVRLAQPFFDVRVLKRNWKLYLSFYLRHTGAHSVWAIFPVYLSDLGASRFWVGAVFALNPFSQFVFMNLFERVRAGWLIRSGLLVSVLVFVAFGVAADFRQVIPIQILLALSWSCLYLGSLKRLMERNAERSTAAGMFQSMFNLAAVSGGLLTGITGAFGYRAVMFVAAGLCAAATLLFFVVPDDPQPA